MAYQGNSNEKKLENAKIEAVGGAQIRETKSTQFKNNMKLIYINILKPNMLSFLGASLHAVIDTWLFKNKQNGAPPGYFANSGYTNYSGMFRSTSLINNQTVQPIQPQTTADYKSISFVSKDKADMALNKMRAVLAEYSKVSINNLFDIADLTGPGREGWNYGWINLSDAYTTMVNGGWWIIVLPEPIRFPNT